MSLQSHYLNLDDIIATSEYLTCTFLTDVRGLGYLNASTDDDNIKAGTKLELPFWLAQKLCGGDPKVVAAEIPKQYSQAYRDMFKAGSDAVDLQSLNSNYYSVATKTPLLDSAQATDIINGAFEVFQGRFPTIMHSSQNATSKEGCKRMFKLDNMERYLFKKGQNDQETLVQWEKGETDKITTAEVVKRHGKRKRDATDD